MEGRRGGRCRRAGNLMQNVSVIIQLTIHGKRRCCFCCLEAGTKGTVIEQTYKVTIIGEIP